MLNPSTAPTYNVDDWQIVFRDSANGLRADRIPINGTTVTSVPSSAVRFSKADTHIQVLTPASGHYRILTATDPPRID